MGLKPGKHQRSKQRFHWRLLEGPRPALCMDYLRLPHASRFFVVELQIFCRGQIGLKFVGTSACRTLADFLLWLTTFSLGPELISAMFEKRLVHVTLMTIPHWLRYARAPTNCLDLPHTSRQGPTRRVVIQHCQISPDKPRFCGRLVWIHCTLADKWRSFGGRQKIS